MGCLVSSPRDRHSSRSLPAKHMQEVNEDCNTVVSLQVHELAPDAHYELLGKTTLSRNSAHRECATSLLECLVDRPFRPVKAAWNACALGAWLERHVRIGWIPAPQQCAVWKVCKQRVNGQRNVRGQSTTKHTCQQVYQSNTGEMNKKAVTESRKKRGRGKKGIEWCGKHLNRNECVA